MTTDIIALVCSIGISHAECIPQTARVSEKIGEARLPIDCLRSGALGAPRGVTVGLDEYVKVMCVPR